MWNSAWSFVFTVDAATLTDGQKCSLATVGFSQNSSTTTYIAGASLTMAGSNATITYGGWNNVNLTGTVDLSSAQDITFVLERDNSNGRVSLKAYLDGDFSSAVYTQTGSTNLSFSNSQVPLVQYGGLGTLAPNSNGNNTYRQLSDDEISSFGITNAGYKFGASMTAAELAAYYSPAVQLIWNGTEGNNTWNTTAKTWKDAQAVFQSGNDVVFDSTAAVKTVVISESITAGGITVGDNYTFSAGAGISLTALSVDVAADKVLSVSAGEVRTGALTGGGKLDIASGAAVYVTDTLDSFSYLVTGQGDLHLAMANKAEGGDDGRIILAEGSDIANIYVENGCFAVNLNQQAASSKLYGADLHMKGGTFLVRNGAGAGDVSPTENVYISGEVILRAYGSVTADTILSTNFIKEDGQDATLKRTDGGAMVLTGEIDATVMYIQAGTTILGEGNSTTLGQLRMGEQGAGGLKVAEGAKLVITGTDNTQATSRSLLLAHWNQSPTLTMEGGEIISEGARMFLCWDGTGTFSATAGTANLLGIDFTAHSGNRGHVLLGSATEGSARINLGADGIKALAGSADLTLGEGTMGATADWSTAEGSIAAHLVGTVNGTIFDTAKADDETQGYTITLNNGFDGDGKLAKAGAGTLALKAASTYTGGTTIDGGTLQVANATALGTGAVTLNDGTLEIAASASLAAQTLTQTGGTISVLADQTLTLGNATLTDTIANAGTVAFSTGTVNLDGLEVQTVAAGYIDETGDEEATEGFVKSGSKYVQVVTEKSTVSAATDTVFTHKDAKETVTLEAETGRAIVEAAADTDWTKFEIKAQSHDLSNIAKKSKDEKSAIATVIISGGSLTVDSADLSSGKVEATGGTVTLNSMLGTLDVKSTTTLTVNGTSAATNMNVLESATIGGAFHATNFSAGTGITATVKDNAGLGTLAVQGTLALNGAATAASGTVNDLTMGSGSSLTTTGDLALTTASGTGSLNIGGSLTLGGAVSLDSVTANGVQVGNTASVTLTGVLTTGSVELLSVATPVVEVGSLGGSEVDFKVSADAVAALGMGLDDTLVLAYVGDAYEGKLTVNGGTTLYHNQDVVSYEIGLDGNNNVILTAVNTKSDYEWTGGDSNWGDTTHWAKGEVPQEDSWVQLDKDGTISMDVDGEAGRVTVYSGADMEINGNGSLSITTDLEVQKDSSLAIGNGMDSTSLSAETGKVEGTLSIENGAAAAINELSVADGGAVLSEGDLVVQKLLGGKGACIGGTVTVSSDGTVYGGDYDNATVDVAKGGSATMGAAEGLGLAGSGKAVVSYAKSAAMDAIHADGLTLVLNGETADNAGKTLDVLGGSALQNGTIVSGLSAVGTAGSIDSGAAPQLVSVTAGMQRSAAAGLDLAGTTVVLNQTEGADVTEMAVNNGGKTKGLVLAYLGSADTDAAVTLNGGLFAKYYKNARLVGGSILVDMNDTYYQDIVGAVSANSRSGAAMLDDAFAQHNPQLTNPAGDLAQVMDALEGGALRGAAKETVAAAMAGASAAAMGVAFNSDVDRQLRAIRNRTTTMGLAECDRHEGLPYFNAWVNAEGDFNKLGADGTLAGYKMSSWGATLGVDVDFTNRLTAGLAVTAMQGDFTANSAEQATGDLDRIYVSAFARYGYRAWTHTFVATLGKADTSLERTVNYGTGSYTAKGDSDGTAFGLMYEAGYTKALDEDGSTCLQPLFNISYRHSSLGGYTETGSDAALRVGSADMDTVSFGLGARLQSVVGTSVYNRASLFECRALLRLDAGDRDAAVKSNFTGLAGDHSVKSAEVGAFGLELGAGLTLPMSVDAGNIFMDVSMDLRSGYSSVNGTVGYRINF
ncbi:MAG: autotransporter domain-containing protein [Akkermansia sp.]|nr:autotransporter domain-containing protein [Akkermansia sp.]